MQPIRIEESKSLLFEGCFSEDMAENGWGKWEEMDSREADDPRYAHYHQIHVYPEESRAYEIRFYNGDFEYTDLFTGLAVTREEPNAAWEYMTIPLADYAVFDIDYKVDTGAQFEGVLEWLRDSDAYRQVRWNGGRRAVSNLFVICQFDHRGKWRDGNVMECWLPITGI